jgi:hypothetical protein
MTEIRPLRREWKELLGLAYRRSPELYESSDTVTDAPHALAIRAALDDLGLTAVFCVQGIPTVGILLVDQYDRARIVDLHAALWNQGLASVLLVISDDTLRAFSIARTPYRDSNDEFDKRCLIETLENTAEALRFRNLVYGIESGRLWQEYADYFKPKERIDQVLLENLTESHQLLCKAHLSSEAAQALLIQTMFIAYLEDREIITPEYFSAVAQEKLDSFASLLATRNVGFLKSLFTSLRADFNGDLFVAPCSFESEGEVPDIDASHLDIIARFRTGREEMSRGGQHRFWGYNFRYIPIELVSAVYDRFLGEKEEERREQGAYYTPMFLADTVVSQVWELLPSEVREKGRYLDPACGSGVFLVRSFQRLCEHWRATRTSQTIRWDSLLAILQRVHGWDVNRSAVRVAVFSLYVALLEEVTPPDICGLIKRGKLLPELWNKTLAHRDFFEASTDQAGFHVIIGNPPWTSRRGPNRSSVRWCKKNHLPMPGREDAWAFAWKALRHLAEDGVVTFLLPAMGFLHNHAANTVAARQRFIRESHIRRIINFADLRFQLFEHAHRPAALFIFGRNQNEERPYRFDYWTPKADLNLQMKRSITLSSADKSSLSTATVVDNPLAFKQQLWMREPDAKLFNYLSKFPKLGAFIKDFGGVSRRRQDITDQWIIGQGYQPHNSRPNQSSPYSISDYVGKLPDLPIAAFRRLAQPVFGLAPWPSQRVRRRGFEAGFEGARILVPRGIETSQMRLRAAYADDAFTFQHIIQAIVVPTGQEARAKLLTGLLNSRIAIWYAFHGTASFGSDRPEVQQAELLRLPFPNSAELPDPGRAADAGRKITALVDDAVRAATAAFALDNGNDAILSEIDQLAYQYFCLSDDEVILVEDALEKIIPAVQPHQGNYPDLWKAPAETDRRAYATTLIASLSPWLSDGLISAQLEAATADLGVLRLSLDTGAATYTEAGDASLADALSRISEHIRQPLDGNFQLMPDLRVFVGQNLYLIKPMQQRFWLRSAALADADAIAMDLQDAVTIERRRSQS